MFGSEQQTAIGNAHRLEKTIAIAETTVGYEKQLLILLKKLTVEQL
jgi:hypothetical protein